MNLETFTSECEIIFMNQKLKSKFPNYFLKSLKSSM